MTTQQLAQQLNLNPRALLMHGTIIERPKTSAAGMISGFTPHYTMTGCPPVSFDSQGAIVPSAANAAAIEASFSELPQGEAIATIIGTYGKPLNMLHLQFGRPGITPNEAEARLLREAGETFRLNANKAVMVAVLPVCSSAAMGVAQVRLCPLGVFSTEGQPIWLHPVAVGSLLKAEYPASQIHRSLVPKPAQQVAQQVAQPDSPHWYDKLLEVWKAKKPKATPTELHELIIDRRAERLVDDGLIRTKTEAVAVARREAAEHRQEPKASSKPSPQPEPAIEPPAPKQRLTSARIKS